MDEDPGPINPDTGIRGTYVNSEYKYPTCIECDEMIEICICEE